MARMARIVVPNYPHHITQRGNRRQQTFFSDDDYRAYKALLVEAKLKANVEVWAYCFMPNHVHLIVVPEHTDSLSRFFSEAHRRYTRRVNFREGWRGHLWQERFHSSVMDENYLLAAVRYTELNPVRASLCAQPDDWEWSSVHAHMAGEDDDLVTVSPMLERVQHWPKYLRTEESNDELELLREHARSGRPIGDDEFLDVLECVTARSVRRCKPGPKPQDK